VQSNLDPIFSRTHQLESPMASCVLQAHDFFFCRVLSWNDHDILMRVAVSKGHNWFVSVIESKRVVLTADVA
jgi:hypothetical protein